MTMVPPQSLSKQQQEQHHNNIFYGGYGSCGGGGYNTESFGVMNRIEVEGYDYCISEANCILGSSDLVAVSNNPMAEAEDDSRTNSLNEAAGSSSKDNNNNTNNNNNSRTITPPPSNNNNGHKNTREEEGEEEDEEEEEERDEGWLQLSIGGNTTAAATTTMTGNQNQSKYQHEMDPATRGGGGLIELDLLPGGASFSNQAAAGRPLSSPIFHLPSRSPPVMNIAAAGATSFTASLFFHQQQQQQPAGSSSSSILYPHHQHQEINWAYRHLQPHNIAMVPSSSSSPNSQSSSSSLMPLMGGSNYFSRPFQVHSSGVDVAGPSSCDFRVIETPRRPHSGVWFTLQASQNQAQEPFLPQISKSYLRVKDGMMTVRLLMKYLVNKLRLNNESEVEITCRGQQLLPFLTLQHVRDSIWSPRDAVTLLPDSSSTDHIMVLHYGRTPQK